MLKILNQVILRILSGVFMVDCLIRNGFILTMKGSGVGFIENGAVAIDDGEIVAVGKSREVSRKIGSAEERIDASGMVVMPGLINGHVHTVGTLARGECQDVPEIEWMIKTASPFSKHLDSELAVKSSALGVLEGMKTGTTLFAEYGSYLDELVSRVYLKFGVRAFICSPISEVVGLTGQDPYKPYLLDREKGRRMISEALKLVDKWHGALNDRIRCCLGPVAADMLTKETLLEVKEIAEKKDLLMHIHLAQGGRESIQIKLRYNTTTVRFLDSIGFLTSRLIGAHCHGASEEEIQIIAKRGVRMASCPTSIALIDGMVSPLYEYLNAGGKAAVLGTDQANGNNCLNMFREMKMAAILNKVRHRDPTVLPAWKILRIATIEGAKCLGLDDIIGSIEVGKKADLIIINLKKPNLTPILFKPIRNIVFNLVYSANGSEVELVMVDGKILVENGKCITVEEEKIIEEAQKAAEKLAEKSAEDYVKGNPLILKYQLENLI